MQEGAEQVGSGWARVMGAAQRLALRAHRLTPQVAVLQKPWADAGIPSRGVELLQDPPEGRLGRRPPALRA